jgi:perosamine synthetase
LKNVVGNGKVQLHEPVFKGNESKYVQECIDSTFVSSVGKFVDTFEKKLAEFTGAQYAVATVNGTAALHMCLQLAGVDRGDEVLVPALSFVATANAVRYCGAIPHFVDSSHATLGMCSSKLGDYLKAIADIRSDGFTWNKITGRRIRACVPMHTFGFPVDLDPLIEICNRYTITVIEDAAESMGSYYHKKHTGRFGFASALSFNGNKIMTTGGGGAILTDNQAIGKLAKHLTTTAKVPHRWEFFHDQLGYNYRMPNINAALGCAQLEMLPFFIDKKRALASRYHAVFKQVKGVSLFIEPEFAQSNYWLNVLLLDVQHQEERDQILDATNNCGIMTRPAWTLLNRLPMFADCPKMPLDAAADLERRIINIPSSSSLIKAQDSVMN